MSRPAWIEEYWDRGFVRIPAVFPAHEVAELSRHFDEILAQDFYCSNPDKSLVDRAGFLKQTAVPVTIKNLAAHDVKIRILGDFAIIHATTSYTTPDGKEAHGRYTDCWARQNGRWLAVSAHVSR